MGGFVIIQFVDFKNLLSPRFYEGDNLDSVLSTYSLDMKVHISLVRNAIYKDATVGVYAYDYVPKPSVFTMDLYSKYDKMVTSSSSYHFECCFHHILKVFGMRNIYSDMTIDKSMFLNYIKRDRDLVFSIHKEFVGWNIKPLGYLHGRNDKLSEVFLGVWSFKSDSEAFELMYNLGYLNLLPISLY